MSFLGRFALAVMLMIVLLASKFPADIGIPALVIFGGAGGIFLMLGGAPVARSVSSPTPKTTED